MMIDDTLFIIYSIDSRNNMNRYIDQIYSTKGMIDFDEVSLNDEFCSLYMDNRLGPFESEEDLSNFSFFLSEKYRLEGICLCGNEEINKTLSEVKNITEFNSILFENGNKIKNPKEKKRGIFSGLGF